MLLQICVCVFLSQIFLTVAESPKAEQKTGLLPKLGLTSVPSIRSLIPTRSNCARWIIAARKFFNRKKEALQSFVAKKIYDDCLHNVDDKIGSLDKYGYLRTLQKSKPHKFYECLVNNVEKMAPLVYMPVAGKASKNYNVIVEGELQQGLTFNIVDDRGRIGNKLSDWVEEKKNKGDIDIVLVTDGGRVLGLGDMGANGMPIPEGKMTLYTALGGVDPNDYLAVTLDVGTNSEVYLNKKASKYVGMKKKRESDKTKYYDFIKEFVEAVRDIFGETTLIQFEAFSTEDSYHLLKTYQDHHPVINDDIQGAAATTVAGVLAAMRLQPKTSASDAKVLIVGGGSVYESALGIGIILVEAGFKSDNIYMMDQNGLLTEANCPFGKTEKDKIERAFCHHIEKDFETKNLEKVIRQLVPWILIGVSGAQGQFADTVLDTVKEVNGDLRPPIVVLECTTEESYLHAKDKESFKDKAFESEEEKNQAHIKWDTVFKTVMKRKDLIGVVQCDDDYIFPGVGLGVALGQITTVPYRVFAIAAKTVADQCMKKPRAAGPQSGVVSYPTMRGWIECSTLVATAVVKYALSKKPGAKEWSAKQYSKFVKDNQYKVGNGRIHSSLRRYAHGIIKDECVKGVDSKIDRLEKYIYLRKLQVTDDKNFYSCIIRNVEKLLPIIYTPVVAKACKNYKSVVHQGGEVGITLSYKRDKGHIADRLREHKKVQPVVRAIVVTDGSRVLALGDLGANGMGIPVGKLALYTALGGIDPFHCLPITLDVGTNNMLLRGEKSNMYVGEDMDRIEGPEYDNFIEEFMKAVVEVYGRTTLIQFEDFANPVAFPLLHRYQNDYTVFNDDIQGTAAAAVAGILAAARFRSTSIDDARVLFVGAGSAALGIGTLIVQAMTGGDTQANREKIIMKDAYGLLTSKKCGVPEFKEGDGRRKYCHVFADDKDVTNLAEIVLWWKPNILIGVSGMPKLFTPEVLRNMASVNTQMRPIIMPLSNPTTNSECTAEQAYEHAKGCFFASGSPFAPVYVDNTVLEALGHTIHPTESGKELKPAQCNNDNIFPGVALGIIAAEMLTVPQDLFFIAAKTLANECLQKSDFDRGSLYPEPKHLRYCSVKVAAAVVKYAFKEGNTALKSLPTGWKDWSFQNYEDFVREHQYHPELQ